LTVLALTGEMVALGGNFTSSLVFTMFALPASFHESQEYVQLCISLRGLTVIVERASNNLLSPDLLVDLYWA